MPYIGNEVGNRFVASKAASVYSGDGSTTAFTLEHAVGSDEDILVSVDGVIQEPSVAYAVSSGTTLTFTAAPSSNSGNNIFVYYLFRTVATVDHPSTSSLLATDGTFSSTLNVTGETTLATHLNLGDGDIIKLGAGSDLTLKHDATNSLIQNSTGYLGLQSDTLYLQDKANGHAYLTAVADGAVGLRYDNSEKLATTSSGVDVTGTITLSYDGSDTFATIKGPSNRSLHIDLDANGNTDSFKIRDLRDNSERLVVRADGLVTMPSQSAFLVRPTSTQSNISINAYTTIVFDTEVFDNNSDFASNTFTAPVTGKYQFNCSLYFTGIDTDTTFYQLYVTTSNREHLSIVSGDGFNADPSYHTINHSVLTDMDANDTCYIRLQISSGGSSSADLTTQTRFSGYLVA
jgi:hypothetical protein